MFENEILIEELNDLKLINSERIEKYKKELGKTEDAEYISLVKRIINEGVDYNEELDNEIKTKDPFHISKKKQRTGNIYKNWRNSITALRKSNSKENEIFEFATQRAYENALSSDIYIPSNTANLLLLQKVRLKKSFQLLLKRI